MTPSSNKANLLVMGAGGYRSSDYLKVGTPLHKSVEPFPQGPLTLQKSGPKRAKHLLLPLVPNRMLHPVQGCP